MAPFSQMASVRFLKAYGTTVRILSSYTAFSVTSGWLGEERRRIRLARIHRRNALRLLRTISALKGLFIKIGQLISIMTHFLPEEYRQELEGLQDSVPPHPFAEIEARIREEFGKGSDELFRRLDPVPIASASLGQVHVGELQDGSKVAVKIQYPGIGQLVAADLKTLKRIFGLLAMVFPSYGLRSVYREMALVVSQELDYKAEGKNLERLRENFLEQPEVRFPKVFWDRSSKKVLTMEFMEGIEIIDRPAMARLGIDPREVATRVIHAYCKQIFLDGVYHADPHPGNLIIEPQVGPDGKTTGFKLVMIDFGALATISPAMKSGLTLFVEGLIARNSQTIAAAMRQMGFVARSSSPEAFDKMVGYFYDKLKTVRLEDLKSGDLGSIAGLEDLLELQRLKVSFRQLLGSFHVPKDWVLLERALLLTLGLVTHLDPEINPADIVLPYVEKFVLGKDRSFADIVMGVTKDIGLSYLNLPHDVQTLIHRLEEGQVTVRLHSLEDAVGRVIGTLRSLSYAILTVGAVGLWELLRYDPDPWPARYALAGAALFGLMLVKTLILKRELWRPFKTLRLVISSNPRTRTFWGTSSAAGLWSGLIWPGRWSRFATRGGSASPPRWMTSTLSHPSRLGTL